MTATSASTLVFGRPTTSLLALRRRWARSHPDEYASRLVEVVPEHLRMVAEQLAMSEADLPGEVPAHEASFEAEDGGSICVSVEVLGVQGVEVGTHKVLRPWELMAPELIEAAARAAATVT